MRWSWCRRPPRSRCSHRVRHDGAPECEASPHIPRGRGVEPLRPPHHAANRSDIVTTSVPTTPFAAPAPARRLERAATALTAHGFTVEILDDVVAARTRVKDLIPEGASVFTAASETL